MAINVKNRLRGSVILLFLLVLVVRLSTTLPLLRTLTGAGFPEPAAKAISQIPTVLLIVGVTAWFGWTREIGLRPDDWWSREALWAFIPLLVPIIAVPLLGLQIVETSFIVWLLLDAIFVSIWEELYFRGVFLEQVHRKLPNPRTAVVVSGAVFGLIHLMNAPVLGATPTFVAVQVAFATLGGIGMGAVRLRTGIIWPLILAHFLIDGPERLIFGEQATAAEPVILGLLLVVSAIYAAYGLVATGRMSPREPSDGRDFETVT